MSAQAAPHFLRALKVFLEAFGREELLEICKHLFRSERTAEILMEFVKYRELTVPFLVRERGYPEPTVYTVLNKLKDLDLVEMVRCYQRSRKGGRKTKIYRLKG